MLEQFILYTLAGIGAFTVIIFLIGLLVYLKLKFINETIE